MYQSLLSAIRGMPWRTPPILPTYVTQITSSHLGKEFTRAHMPKLAKGKRKQLQQLSNTSDPPPYLSFGEATFFVRKDLTKEPGVALEGLTTCWNNKVDTFMGGYYGDDLRELCELYVAQASAIDTMGVYAFNELYEGGLRKEILKYIWPDRKAVHFKRLKCDQ